jgi:hypothetical protein
MASVVLAGCSGATSGVTSETTQADGPVKHSDASVRREPSKADLDAYVSAGRRGLKSMLGPSLKKVYSTIQVEPVYPSGIKYVYVFRNQVDVAQAAKQLKTQAPVLKAAFHTQVASEMKRLGFAHPSATWTYMNSDGSLIWTRTFP